MSELVDVQQAQNFVNAWNDPEQRRFAEEYATDQTLDFARLAVAQAEQIKRLQRALHKADKWGDCLGNLMEDGIITEEDMQ